MPREMPPCPFLRVFAGKAKNADIGLAMAPILNAVGEQKNH